MSAVDDIKSRLDILEVVSNHIPLQRSGKSYKANCPFHQEKTPSFFVFPDRQSWRCFGACATGGDVFSFVMKTQNLEFAETLKQLAQQAGVTLPSRERRTEVQSAFDINEAAKAYFQSTLASTQGAEARTYLDRRGLNELTIEKFELGLSPRDGESLKNHLVNQGFSPEQLSQAGVVSGGDTGRYRDLFRNRLIFPIRNGQGDQRCGGFSSVDVRSRVANMITVATPAPTAASVKATSTASKNESKSVEPPTRDSRTGHFAIIMILLFSCDPYQAS